GPFGWNLWQTVVGVLGGLLVLGVVGLMVIAVTLPDPSSVDIRSGEVKLFDARNRPIESISSSAGGGQVVRQVVALNQISDSLRKATVSAEDRHFYEHHGIDFGRLVKAMSVDLIKGSA